VHIVGRRVYNVAYTYGPGGVLLGRTRKCFLTPGAESRSGLSRGRVEDLRALHSPLGRLGVAVCLDGWYDGVLATLDAEGVGVVVQPSANEAPWDRPWPPEPRLREGEAWLERGLRAGLQGRVHLRYGVNPMLVGELFGFRPRGRSSIVANAAAVAGPWVEGIEGVLALAPDAEREGVVTASVALAMAYGRGDAPPAVGGRMRP
jgi:predicted amidohydrolase